MDLPYSIWQSDMFVNHSVKPWFSQRNRLQSDIHHLEHIMSGWFGTFYFSIYWEFHHPNWLIFFRGVAWNHQHQPGMILLSFTLFFFFYGWTLVIDETNYVLRCTTVSHAPSQNFTTGGWWLMRQGLSHEALSKALQDGSARRFTYKNGIS